MEAARAFLEEGFEPIHADNLGSYSGIALTNKPFKTLEEIEFDSERLPENLPDDLPPDVNPLYHGAETVQFRTPFMDAAVFEDIMPTQDADDL